MAAEHEREFQIHELFFSTTDAKGIILSGNEVFCRIAAYEESEMVGRPHSLIRHPEMPRCVFKLLWDTIARGEAIAAYVKNRASTGEPYWVMATVVPCPTGYLSVRLKPTSNHLDTVKAVYSELRTLEQDLGGERELDRKRAMEASGERLLEILRGAGYEDYESFMHQALAAELASRAAQAGGPLDATGPQRRALDHMRRDCLATAAGLDGLFGANLDGYLRLTELSRQLSTKSGFVLELSDNLRLFAINALLASSRMGEEGTVLGAVAGIMRSSSAVMRDLIVGLSDELTAAAGLLREVGFRVSIAKLQALMAIQFTDEVLRRRRPGPEWAKFRDPRTDDIALLGGCLHDSLDLLRTALCALDSHLHNLASQVASLQQDLRAMSALETNGRIEAARMDGAGAIRQQFHEMHEHILQASAQAQEFSTIAQIGRAIASPAAIKQFDRSMTRLRADTSQLIASGTPAGALEQTQSAPSPALDKPRLGPVEFAGAGPDRRP